MSYRLGAIVVVALAALVVTGMAVVEEEEVDARDRGIYGSPIWDPSLEVDPAKVEDIRRILFPYKQTEEQYAQSRRQLKTWQDAALAAERSGKGGAGQEDEDGVGEGRQLQGYHEDPGVEPECVRCLGLSTCRVLNNKRIEETYYPSELTGSGGNANTCTILEELGNRVALEVFGTGRTFRDTPTCREMVNQYLCLFWGSDNLMYRNLCIYYEETDDPEEINHVKSPRPPCRSFCVQVAEVCANDHHFLQLCHDIDCPPYGMDCESDPAIDVGGILIPLDADLGCDLPYELDPYGIGENAAAIARPNHILLALTTLVVACVATIF